MATEGEGRRRRRVPLAATVLGGAGLLPPLLAIIIRLSAGAHGDPQTAHFVMLVALQYVSLILSFLGGIWWGVAAVRVRTLRIAPMLVLSVTPTLAALGIFILSNWFPGPSALLLAVAVGGTLFGDRHLVREELVPSWWMRLRVPLSAALALLTIVLAVLL